MSHRELPAYMPAKGLRETWLCYWYSRQNKRNRKIRKRWSHIPSDLISLLDQNERSLVSLKVRSTGHPPVTHKNPKNLGQTLAFIKEVWSGLSTYCVPNISPMCHPPRIFTCNCAPLCPSVLYCPSVSVPQIEEDQRKDLKIRRARYDKKVAAALLNL